MISYGKSRYARRRPSVPEWIDYGAPVEVVRERLIRARLESAKSQETLGDEIRVSHVYLSECERRGWIGERALEAVAKATGKPLEYFRKPWPLRVPVELTGLDRWVALVRERNGCSLTEWQALIKEAFARYHAEGRTPNHKDLHWQMSAAKARSRFAELLDPVLINGTGFSSEAYQSLADALKKDWQDVRTYALLASSAAAGQVRYK